MKRLFLLFTVVAAVACGSALPERQNWDNESMPLYGDVESITLTEYGLSLRFGEICREEARARNVAMFNEAGDATEFTVYYGDGSVDEKHVYTYDSERCPIEDQCYGSGGSLMYKSICEYDPRTT